MLMRYVLKCLTDSTMILHRVSWGAQTDIMSPDSAFQIKVSSGWVGCKSLSFYVKSFNMDIFSLSSLKFPQLCSISPPIKLSYAEHNTESVALNPFSLPFHTLPVAARVLFVKSFTITQCPMTFQTPYCLLSESQIPDHRARGPSQSNLHPHSRLFPLYHLLHSQLTPSRVNFYQSMNESICSDACSLSMEKSISMPACLVKFYQSVKVHPRSCPLAICPFTLGRIQSVFWSDTAPYTVRTLDTFQFFFKLSCTCSIFLSTSNILVSTSGGTQHALCMQLTLNMYLIELSLPFTHQNTPIIFSVRADIYQVGDTF